MFKRPEVVYWIVFCWLCCLTQTGWSQSARKYFQKGEEHRQKKEYAFAIDHYTRAIELDSKKHEYHFRKGLCELILKQYESALQSFKQAVKVNPQFANGYVYLAKIHINRKEYARAVYYYQKAFTHEDDNRKKYEYKLAVIKYLAYLDKLPEVVREIKLALSLDDSNAELHYRQGQVYAKMGNWVDALQSFQNALERSDTPDTQPRYQYAVGFAHYKLGNYDKFYAAQEALEGMGTQYSSRLKKTRQISIEGSSNYFVRLARSYMEAGFYGEAYTWIEKAMRKGDNLVRSYKMAGYILYRSGMLHRALSYYDEALRIEMDTSRLAQAYEVVLKLQWQVRDYAGMLRTSSLLLQRRPGHIEALYYQALSAYYLHIPRLARFSIERCIERADREDPLLEQYHFLLGMVGRTLDDRSSLKSGFRKAQKGPSGFAAEHELARFKGKAAEREAQMTTTELNKLANAYLQANIFPEAVAYVKKALDRGENPGLSHRIAGKIYYKMKDIPKAIAFLKKSLHYEKDASKLMRINQTLAQLYYQEGYHIKALHTVNNALKISPKNSDLLNLKGLIEFHLDLYAPALISFEKAISHLPDRVDADKKAQLYFAVGMTAKKLGHIRQAKQAFRSAKKGELKLAAAYEIKSFKSNLK